MASFTNIDNCLKLLQKKYGRINKNDMYSDEAGAGWRYKGARKGAEAFHLWVGILVRV